MNNEFETLTILNQVERCEDTDDIRAILKEYNRHYLCWQRYISVLLDESGLSYGKFAKRCEISKNTLKTWCTLGGIPRCRNTYIKIGFGLSMNTKEVNTLLVRYGGYHGLNVKDLFDAVCIYLLEKQVTGYESYTYSDALELYNRCLGEKTSCEIECVETAVLMNEIRSFITEDDFITFTKNYGGMFSNERPKLVSYLQTYLSAKMLPIEIMEDKKQSIHSYFLSSGIPARYEKILSNIFTHGSVPRREQMISLGIYLEMMPDELNKLLSLSGMEELCAKNRIECIIIFALHNLCLTHPEIALSNSMQLISVSNDNDLIENCTEIVEEYTKNIYHCEDGDIKSVAEYVRQILTELDLDAAHEIIELL